MQPALPCLQPCLMAESGHSDQRIANLLAPPGHLFQSLAAILEVPVGQLGQAQDPGHNAAQEKVTLGQTVQCLPAQFSRACISA